MNIYQERKQVANMMFKEALLHPMPLKSEIMRAAWEILNSTTDVTTDRVLMTAKSNSFSTHS